jgi:phosphoribosylcarboxyaminoimidazole (NCAIR) mutase
LLAAQILALADARLAARVLAWRAAQTEGVAEALEDDA